MLLYLERGVKEEIVITGLQNEFFYEGGLRATGIMVSAYDRFKKHLGIDTGTNYVYDMKQMLAIVEEPVLERHRCGASLQEEIFPLSDQRLSGQMETLAVV